MSRSAIALSLISHTNAGKTTLARTLLGRDIGEVRDAPHVTTEATPYPLLITPEGDALMLWDTPGFGDSARLARRLSQQSNPIGWFLSQIWDRFRDEAFHLSQLAARNVRDDADVVLYLVNASEAPADAGYLAPELDVLAWIAKPVFVLLNQTGPPRPRVEEEADEARWREALGQRSFIRGVLTLDAFARCWVQEVVLLRALAPAIATDKRESYKRLTAAWRERRRVQFDAAMVALAAPIARAACDRAPLATANFKDKLRRVLRPGVASRNEDQDKKRAVRLLSERLDAGVRDGTTRVIKIYGLEVGATDAVLERLAEYTRTNAPVSEGKAAMMGGVVSGALSGLAADLAAHGLTLGAGTLIGAVAGAIGGVGIARGYNVLRGRTGTVIVWDDPLLDRLVTSALLLYLAIAHFGRGRGEWKQSEYPPFWQEIVQREVDACRTPLAALWARREGESDSSGIERELTAILAEAAHAVLDALYPGVLEEPSRG